MISIKSKVLIIAAGCIAAGLISGCDEKAPEIPPPEPTAAFLELPVPPGSLRQTADIIRRVS